MAGKVSQADQETPTNDHLYTHQSRMTPEAQAALAAPLDPKFIKKRKGDNGKEYSYADLDYLEGRAREVDPEWSSHLSSGGPNIVFCDITILGVTHSASAGYYIGDTYEVWDWQNKVAVDKPMTSRVAHTTIGAAEAAAERRAFAKFRLGEELWKKEDSEDHAQGSSGNSRGGGGSASAQGNKRPPSPGRLKVLNDLGIPTDVAMQIDSTGHVDAKGQPIKGDNGYQLSNVGLVIDELFSTRGKAKGKLARAVWEPVVLKYQPDVVFNGSSTGADDEDDDWDAA